MNLADPLELAKRGRFAELEELWNEGRRFDLRAIFERAVTDFRTVKRNPGHHKILRFCVDQGLKIDDQTISLAARSGNVAIVDYLKKKGIPDDPFVAVNIGDLESIRRIASKLSLANLHDSSGFNLLHATASSGLGRFDPECHDRLSMVCEFLIGQGVSTTAEVQKEVAITPAYGCAAFGGNAAIMKQLLDHGQIEIAGLHRELEFAIEPHQRSGEPFDAVAQEILARGFDINSIRPSQGRTLLHGCANRGTKAATGWLLENGADPNALDGDGGTPLHAAAKRNTHTSVIALLIEAGANASLRNSEGKTALDVAEANGRDKVVAFLQKHSAEK